MTKVKGPLFSVEAHGSFDNTLVYQRRRGGAAVYRRVVPKNPNTTSQQAQRNSFAAAVAAWAVLPEASKAWWLVKAWGMALTGYNLYIKNYLLGLEEPPPEPPEPPGPPYEPAVLLLEPGGYWRMGEASGDLVDASENGNTAVKYGTLTYGVAGAIVDDPDSAVTLPGAWGTYLRAANSASLDVGNVFTVMAWIKRNGLGTWQSIVSRGTNGYWLGFGNGNDLVLMKNGDGLVVHSTGTTTDSNWHFVAATKNGPTSKLYIDGGDVSGTVTDQTIVATGGVTDIGQSAIDGSASFDGSLDEVAVFPLALSADDILTLWELGSGV